MSIHDVREDSRSVAPGCLFVARKGGTYDGLSYLTDAQQAGAAAALVDQNDVVPASCERGMAILRTTNVGQMARTIAERVHGNPSQRLKVVGITGTNGKTTVTYFLQLILRHAGVRFGLLGTIWCDDGLGRHTANLTTPSGTDISRHLGRMARAGYVGCAMEVSSHALDQGRVDAINFDGAIFTNLTGDHLDYHGSMASYEAAKAKLFKQIPASGWGVINSDDDAAIAMSHACGGKIITSSTEGQAMCQATVRDARLNGTHVTVTGEWGDIEAFVPVVGLHNTANVLQAVAAAWALGVDRAGLERGLSCCQPPPGRLEFVAHDAALEAPTVLVDYAHTDDALDRVLSALRPLVPQGGRLRVVFGCGGDRDRTKRPRMGQVASRWADELFVTSDNPRTEDPQGIINEICRGIPSSPQVKMQQDADRGIAIARAIEDASHLDLILIAGKGHEPYQIIGTQRTNFDDREVARAALGLRAGVGSTSC